MQASYGEARRSARSAKAAGPAQTNPDAYVFFDICAAANAPVTPRCVERIALGGNVAGRCLQATHVRQARHRRNRRRSGRALG